MLQLCIVFSLCYVFFQIPVPILCCHHPAATYPRATSCQHRPIRQHSQIRITCASKSKPSGDAPIPGYIPFTHIPVSNHDMPLLMKLVAKVSLAKGSFSTPYFIASVDIVAPHNCPRTRIPLLSSDLATQIAFAFDNVTLTRLSFFHLALPCSLVMSTCARLGGVSWLHIEFTCSFKRLASISVRMKSS